MAEMFPLKSTNVSAAGLDGDTLLVEFHSGSTYAIGGSSEAELQDLLTSPSPGAWYARNVKQAGRTARRVG